MLQTVHHGDVGAEITAPAHAHGGEYSDVVGGSGTGSDHAGNQTDGGAGGTQSGDGNSDTLSTGEAEERLEDEGDLVTQPGEEGNAFVSATGEAALGSAVGEHHDHGADDENAGDDVKAQLNAGLTAAHEALNHAHTNALLALFLFLAAGDSFQRITHCLGAEDLLGLHEHQTSADDTADEGAQVTDQSSDHQIFAGGGLDTDHEGGDDQTHAESGAQIGEGGELILLEIAAELAVVGEGKNGGVVGEVSSDDTQRGRAGQTEQGLHQGRDQLVDEVNHTELAEQCGNSAGQNRNSHNIEHGIHQKCVGSVHHGAEHVGSAHFAADQTEDAKEDNQKDDGLQRALGLCRHIIVPFIVCYLRPITH